MTLRLVLFALLVIAFSRPYLEDTLAVAHHDEESRGVLLLLDTSYSMTYGSHFERMKFEADKRIGTMSPGDQMALIAFNENASLLVGPSGDLNTLKTVLAEMAPSSGKTSYYEAFKLADRVLAQLDGYKKEIVLISDFQRSGWNRSSREGLIDGDVVFDLVDLGEGNPENVSIENLSMPGIVFTRTFTGQILSRLHNHQLADHVTVPVSLILNDRQVSRKNITIPAGSTAIVEFTGFVIPLGFSRGQVRIEQEDALMLDNEFFFALQRRERLKLLILDAGESKQSYFLEQALISTPAFPFTVSTRSINLINTGELVDYDVVIINDVPCLPIAIEERLVELRKNGQGQLVFFAENTELECWNNFQDLPVQLVNKIYVQKDRGQRFLSLSSYERNHEIFAPLDRSARLTLSTTNVFAYTEMKMEDGAIELAKYENGVPAIVELRDERSRFLVFGSSVDNRWNNLPLKPSFLPLIHETVRYLAKYSESKPWYQLGEVIPVPTLEEQIGTLITPTGQRQDLENFAGSEGQVFVPDLIGFYEVRLASETKQVAVNFPSSESRLVGIPPEDLMVSVQRMEGELSRGEFLSESSMSDSSVRQNWWWYFFLFALFVGIGEIYLSNRITANKNQGATSVNV